VALSRGRTDCLVGCIQKYNCKGLNVPPNYHTLAPFVEATFIAKNLVITVGNESAPFRTPPHTVVIKSFEYGHTDGIEMKLEIIDEEGGSFSQFVHNMIKCAKKATQDRVLVKVRFGWIGTTCDRFSRATLEATQQPIWAGLQDMEVNFTEGKFKYNITCKDAMNMLFSTKEDYVCGDDAAPKRLRYAIEEICGGPPSINVRFKRIDQNGKDAGPIEWLDGGSEGPFGTWAGNKLDRLSTIRTWLSSHRMKPRGQNTSSGVVIYWDPFEKNTLIIQQEDSPMDDCKSANNVGTFIVNGGKCSNVLEFSPKMNYPSAWAQFGTGGTESSSDKGEMQTKEKDAGKLDFQKKHDATPKGGMKAGLQVKIDVDERNRINRARSQQAKETGKANEEHAKANAKLEELMPVSAEMRIVGDPREEMLDPTKFGTITCSIVVINPFHIRPFNNRCGEWMAMPGCNTVLSNKAWRILGTNHTIKEGSYVTTLKLMLEVPDIDIPGQTFGGSGGNFKPENLCD